MVRGTPWIDLANGGVPKQLRRQIVPGCRPSPQSCRRRLLYLQKSRRIESSRRLNVIPMTSLHLLQRRRADQSTFDRMGRNLAPKPKLAGREPKQQKPASPDHDHRKHRVGGNVRSPGSPHRGYRVVDGCAGGPRHREGCRVSRHLTGLGFADRTSV